MIPKTEDFLKVAVIEDAFSFRDYKGEERIEYCVTPYTAPDELEEALEKISPDLVILSETYQKAVLNLKDKYIFLLAVDEFDVHKFRRAFSLGMKGVVVKPVTYEKIVLALKGKMPQENPKEGNIIYFGAPAANLPRAKKPEIKVELPPIEEVLSMTKEIKQKARLLTIKDEKGKIITFYSAKGGVGKTLYSVNTAVHAARMHPSRKIALVDFDLDLGDVAYFLGIEPRITALSWHYIPEDSLKEAEVEKYLIKHPSGVFVLSAPIPPIDEEVFSYQTAGKILSTLKRHFDLIVVDLGPNFRDVSVITLEYADMIFLISTDEGSSLRKIYDLDALIKIFEALKKDKSKIFLLLTGLMGTIDTKELKKYIPYEVALKVPFIKQIKTANAEGRLALENKRFRIYLDDLVYKVFNREPEKKSLFSFWKK